jgi:hypothetical protein
MTQALYAHMNNKIKKKENVVQSKDINYPLMHTHVPLQIIVTP